YPGSGPGLPPTGPESPDRAPWPATAGSAAPGRGQWRYSPRSSWIGPLQMLHLGQDVAQRFGVAAMYAAPICGVMGLVGLGYGQRCLGQRGFYMVQPGGPQAGMLWYDLALRQLQADLVIGEQFTHEAPGIVDRVLH